MESTQPSLDNGQSDHSEEDNSKAQDEMQELVSAFADLQTLPNALMFTNLPAVIFEESAVKEEFESLIASHSELELQNVQVQYLRNFRRVRAQFANGMLSAKVKAAMDGIMFYGSPLSVYFIKVRETTDDNSQHLQPPALEKQFLISPPASPPVGWQPAREAQPVINFDLLSAVSHMAPGESHVLHQGSDSYPSVVVHIAEAASQNSLSVCAGPKPAKTPIPQTRCPARRPS